MANAVAREQGGEGGVGGEAARTGGAAPRGGAGAVEPPRLTANREADRVTVGTSQSCGVEPGEVGGSEGG